MKTWFTSDTHFGHKNIVTYQPNRAADFGMRNAHDVVEMSERIIVRWNEIVNPEDTVYIVGDFAMGIVSETIEYARRLNGRKILIPGNHDRMHPIMHKSDEKTAEWERIYADVGFENIGIGPHEMVIDGIKVLVSHFPYSGDHTDEVRYGEYRPADNGMPLVHGHVHGLWKTNGRQFNVGVDAHGGQFVSPEQIGSYFRSIGF